METAESDEQPEQRWRAYGASTGPRFGTATKGPNIAGYDPLTAELTPLFNLRTHTWTAHFWWDGPTLVGKTPIARATMAVLNINAPERVEHRRLLMAADLFPPSPRGD